MKKAIEYVREFRERAGDLSEQKIAAALGEVAKQMVQEITELARVRNAKSGPAIFAIVEEINYKWRKFAAEVPEANPEGFERIVERLTPEVYQCWRRYYRNIARSTRAF